MLDGMTTDTSGNLYVTDYHYGGSEHGIFKIKLSTLEYYRIASPATGLSPAPQDLLFDKPNNRLLIVFAANNAPIQALSLTDTSITTILNSTPGIIDGIEMDNQGNYFLTSWTAGALFKYDHEFINTPATILSGLNGPSNLGYNRVHNILAVPVYNSDTIIFLDLSNTGIKLNSNESVSEFRLHQNYPNPFNPSTVIKFEILKSGAVKLEIYNSAGVLIETPVCENLKTGSYEFIWNASGYASGIYFCRLTTNCNSHSRKMVFLK
ncbi:MAG: T9SS type A sorting domain-containing protein [Ignavibacteria bacterium]|nr:T9SS type A sorting domain-containing protein [Ignavibacteria bacterium]